MEIQWNFSEFTKFANNLADFHDFESAMMTATQNIARVLHKYLLVQTPVKTGNLRKMWSAGDNLLFTVEPVKNGYEVTFINTARANHKDGFMYGLAVNDGHKATNGNWVVGRFFVERAIVQTAENNQLNDIIMKELRKWWEGCLNA